MPQQIMWDRIAEIYRGQAENRTVVTIDREAMEMAVKKAGNTVFEADWWTETLPSVLAHWGIHSKRWTDEATRVPRLHFSMLEPGEEPGANTTASGPLSTRILNSGNLSTRILPQDKVRDE